MAQRKEKFTHESLRVRCEVLQKIREHVAVSKHTMTGYAEIAILEKLERERRTEKVKYDEVGKRMGSYPV